MRIKNNTVYKIQKIREKNNLLWCQLMDIALEKAPKRTKAILAEIKKNDQLISQNMEALTK